MTSISLSRMGLMKDLQDFSIGSSSFTSSVITMIASGIGQCRQTFQIDENDHEKYDFAEADFFDVACVLGRPSCRVASIPAVQGG